MRKAPLPDLAVKTFIPDIPVTKEVQQARDEFLSTEILALHTILTDTYSRPIVIPWTKFEEFLPIFQLPPKDMDIPARLAYRRQMEVLSDRWTREVVKNDHYAFVHVTFPGTQEILELAPPAMQAVTVPNTRENTAIADSVFADRMSTIPKTNSNAQHQIDGMIRRAQGEYDNLVRLKKFRERISVQAQELCRLKGIDRGHPLTAQLETDGEVAEEPTVAPVDVIEPRSHDSYLEGAEEIFD